MNNPIGIQRKRTKGFRLPKNTICVNRPSKFGNPFIVDKHGNREECVKLFEYLCGGMFCLTADNFEAQKLFYCNLLVSVNELKGKNLACFCKTGTPCHRDILLKIANK